MDLPDAPPDAHLDAAAAADAWRSVWVYPYTDRKLTRKGLHSLLIHVEAMSLTLSLSHQYKRTL